MLYRHNSNGPNPNKAQPCYRSGTEVIEGSNAKESGGKRRAPVSGVSLPDMETMLRALSGPSGTKVRNRSESISAPESHPPSRAPPAAPPPSTRLPSAVNF